MKSFGTQKWMLGVLVAVMLTSGFSWAASLEKGTHGAKINARILSVRSQIIAKDYFYIQQKLEITSAKRDLKKNVLLMSEALRRLQSAIKDPEKQKVVDFMMMSLDELKSTLKKDFNQENGGLIMDYTDAILEGAQSFSAFPSMANAKDMFAVTALMKFNLIRASKYYIAFRAGYNDPLTVEEAKKAVNAFSTLLAKVQNYNYPSHLANGPVKKLSKYWPASKSFYLGLEKNALPTIVFISTKHMLGAINQLIAFHKKELK